MGIIAESNNCNANSISTINCSKMCQQSTEKDVNDFSTTHSSEENIDTNDQSSNSEATEITKEFFENYPVLEIPWDDPSLYVEEEALNEDVFSPVSIPPPSHMHDRWSCLDSEPSKNFSKITKRKNQNMKTRNYSLKSQGSEESFMTENSDCYILPNLEENSINSIFYKLDQNYQRQNYIHQKILQLQEEAYQLEYEAQFLQSTLYQQQQYI
uniref:Uncharacterized protein n=1 Tax=Panagrolaimus superbus TaxID=310955 RepID=A0A914YSL5_9BILA